MIAGLWLLAFWLAAALVVAPKLQRDLEAAAHAATRDLPTGYQAPEVRVAGLEATVSGRVRQHAQRAEILATVKEKVRAEGPLGGDLNPIQKVHDALEVVPYPPGWLMIAANGTRGQLLGEAATEYEARDLGTLLGQKWSEKGGYLDNRIKPNPGLYDESLTAQTTTLARLPLPRTDVSGDSAQIQLARIGGDWQRLVLDAKDESLREKVIAMGIEPSDWEKSIQPALQNVRNYQSNQRAIAAEAERQAKLPPPHLFLAARDKRLLVRGEVATLALKRELLNALIDVFPEWRVLDDVRVNAQRRAVADFGPISEALLPSETNEDLRLAGKSLVLGLPGAAWKKVDFEVGGEAQPWKDLLPKDLPPAMLQDDSRMVVEWLQGSAKGIPKLPVRLQPSFITLTLLPDKVILAGQLAEEPARTQIIESARQKYAGRAVVMAESLLARGTCEPSGDLQQTLRSFPDLPEMGSQGVIAFSRPGQAWKSIPASEKLLEPGAVAASGLLPQEFPAAMAEDTFLDGFDHLRHHWKSLTTAPPPAPATQPPESRTGNSKPNTAN
ncbi:hypothetical protein BGE01nite_26350 [Brevifollis gellanilyticus]|uniref:Uncharacterized protein n=1 Tax=Brevifollis gellanilyticus TaxID=748831 RepID=A0A512M9C3_9BACT|nr:hypothetical protein BGE01nite_26350 [Brevifollis gellanilyticus]